MSKKNNSKKLYLLALTPCCVDHYPQIGKSYMGGNSLNVASMWYKLEPYATISVITCLGNDPNGKMILDFFKKTTIDISRVYIREGMTASNKLRVDEHGERFGIEGAWQGGVYETFQLSDSDWDWVARQDIVAMPANNPNFGTMIKKKHPRQMLSVDYLDIENNIPFAETVAFTDIAFITARTGLLPKYKELAFKLKKLIVVTLGAQGSYAYFNGESYYQPALSAPEVIDTTGCGDAYQAAFALTYYKTQDIQKSMRDGAHAAFQILQAWGGVGNFD
jgi:fructoselysine 6-kinase